MTRPTACPSVPGPPADSRVHRLSVPGPVSLIRYCKRDHVRRAILAAGAEAESVPGMTGPSDLIPGKYEGGFKVWEATGDLIQWISDNAAVVQDKVILDLGCGAGLVGIACLLAGAGRVTFHDFNETVIEYFTKANVSLNICPLDGNDKSLPNNVSFAFGDWNQFYPAEKFDLIFSSETIYDEKSYGDMISLIKRSLKPEGSALIAAKTYYFGVGGGTRSFEQFVERDKCLHPQPVKVIAAPVQREIMQLRFT